MQTIKFNVADRALSVAEWPTFVPANNVDMPIIYPIYDGAAKLFLTPSFNFWISKETWDQLKYTQRPEVPKEIPAAPNPQFSESFILKLVAIAQDVNLAKDLT